MAPGTATKYSLIFRLTNAIFDKDWYASLKIHEFDEFDEVWLVIDDRLPVSVTGQLICAAAKPAQDGTLRIWPSLVEKAVSYTQIPSSQWVNVLYGI